MSYDLIVIGTGPGGYVCAIRAAQLGMKVAVVEKRKTHGGTCLNVGCIPSKALLHASEMFEQVAHDFPALGISVGKPTLDLPAMMKHKDDTVAANVNGVGFLLKKNKVDAFFGLALRQLCLRFDCGDPRQFQYFGDMRQSEERSFVLGKTPIARRRGCSRLA